MQQLPLSLTEGLARIPRDLPVMLLVRHSTRGPLPEGQSGHRVPLTPEGEAMAFEFGQLLGGRLVRAETSPVGRCVRTADQMLLGAGLTDNPRVDPRLGDPGMLVEDSVRVRQIFVELGFHGLLRHLFATSDPPSGFRPIQLTVHALIRDLAMGCESSGIHAFVSHDSIIAIVAATVFGGDPVAWLPEFLEGIWVWREGDGLWVLYRNHRTRVVIGEG